MALSLVAAGLRPAYNAGAGWRARVMRGEAHVEITDNPDLLRVVEEVRRTKRSCVLSRNHEPIAVIRPVRKAARAQQPSAADLAATRSAAGAWKGLVDV